MEKRARKTSKVEKPFGAKVYACEMARASNVVERNCEERDETRKLGESPDVRKSERQLQK